MYAMLILVLVLGGCAASKATYMEGGENSMAVIDVTMTGAKISINGPFKYCSEPAVTDTGANGETAIPTSICTGFMEPEDNADVVPE